MEIVSNPQELNQQELAKDRDLVVTIGNFDGVHLGHLKILRFIKEHAKSEQLKLAVFTFIPHPRKLFDPNAKNFLINSYLDRRKLIENEGSHYLVEIPFTRDFSTFSPAEFLDNYILPLKRLKKIFVGFDFNFGADQKGDFDFMKNYLKDKKIEIEKIPQFDTEYGPVSSSLIREKISIGDFELANKLLNREFFLKGIVEKGKGRGKQIGFPTANIVYDSDLIIPGPGVYVTQSKIGNMTFDSVTNVGKNPTFNNGSEINVETHILNFDQNIYGEKLKVSFFKKLRDEVKFSSVNDLVTQIDLDIQKAITYLNYLNK